MQVVELRSCGGGVFRGASWLGAANKAQYLIARHDLHVKIAYDRVLQDVG